VDPDLRAHVPFRVVGEGLHRTARATHLDELVEADPGLVVVGDHHHLRVDALDAGAERVGHRPPAVEDARAVAVGELGALARDAVVRRRVPRDDRLPHVVVRLVAVLVVRRVQVGEIEVAELREQRDRVTPDRGTLAGEQVRAAEREALVRAGRPLLQVRHLHAGGGVDPVGRLDEARQQDGEERVPPAVLDGITDGVDAGAVLGTEVPGVVAERAGHVAGRAVERVERREVGVERVEVERARVGGDRALGEDRRVPGAVDGGDHTAAPLQLLGDAGGAGEEVEGGPAPRGREERTDDVDEAPLGTQVLDRHGRRRYPRNVTTLRRRERRRPARGAMVGRRGPLPDLSPFVSGQRR